MQPRTVRAVKRPAAGTPTISVIIPWSDRPELAQSLELNSMIFSKHSIGVVVVNCGGNPHTVRRIIKREKLVNTRVVDIPCRAFNKALAINLGVYSASSRFIFLIDADIVFRYDFIERALALANSSSFVTIGRVTDKRSKLGVSSYVRRISYVTSLVLRSGRTVSVRTNSVQLENGFRASPGLILFMRKHFLKVGGMNSDLIGWGWEDIDLLFRLQANLQLTRRYCGAANHIDGSSKLYSQSRRAGSELRNSIKCLSRYTQGDLNGTYSDDVAEWSGRIVVREYRDQLDS